MAKLNVTRKQKDSVADDAEKPPCSSDSENETLKKKPINIRIFLMITFKLHF
jgi:hypothetical protein